MKSLAVLALAVLLALSSCRSASTAPSERKTVLATVQAFFDAMPRATRKPRCAP